MSPSKETVCGLPLALSLTETVPKLKELDGGIHLTVMVQDFPAPRFVSQLFVSEKAAPVIPMPVMLNVVLPKLVSVTDFPGLVVPTSWAAKVTLVGDKVAFGPETTPVPLREAICGLPAALSETLSAALP